MVTSNCQLEDDKLTGNNNYCERNKKIDSVHAVVTRVKTEKTHLTSRRLIYFRVKIVARIPVILSAGTRKSTAIPCATWTRFGGSGATTWLAWWSVMTPMAWKSPASTSVIVLRAPITPRTVYHIIVCER